MPVMCPVREEKCLDKCIKPKAWFSTFKELKKKISCERKHLFIMSLLSLLAKRKGLRNGYSTKTSSFSQDVTTVSLPPLQKIWEIIIKDTNKKGFWRE